MGSLVPCVLNDAELESTVGRFPSRSLNGGASPHLCGALHHLFVGLPLCGALPHLAHSTVGLFSLYCGALLTLLWGFPTSPWGFISLWGSSPSRSLDCGALLTLLWGSSHSTVGLPHLSVGLHLTPLWGFPTSPWGFISLWGSSPSRSLNWSLRGSSLSRSLNCTLT